MEMGTQEVRTFSVRICQSMLGKMLPSNDAVVKEECDDRADKFGPLGGMP